MAWLGWLEGREERREIIPSLSPRKSGENEAFIIDQMTFLHSHGGGWAEMRRQPGWCCMPVLLPLRWDRHFLCSPLPSILLFPIYPNFVPNANFDMGVYSILWHGHVHNVLLWWRVILIDVLSQGEGGWACNNLGGRTRAGEQVYVLALFLFLRHSWVTCVPPTDTVCVVN